MIELACRRFSGDLGRHLLITAGVHGDEYEPMLAVSRLVERLESLQREGLPLRGTVTLVPIVNRAAFARDSRVADDGLDLARVCPGRPEGSVTEQTAHALAALIREADFYIDLHTGGTRFSILPLAGYVLHPNPAILEQQRRMARAFNLPLVWGTDPTLDGRSLSVARDAGIPAIYAEHGRGGQFQADCVDDYVQGCLNVMRELGMIDAGPNGIHAPPSRVELVIEDPRPNSGHLQLHHPAPITGLFEPAVRLGDQVSAGDLLGTVSNPLVCEPRPIRSQHTGIVGLLRTFAGVHEGEAIAVVLEPEFARPPEEHRRP